MYQVSEHSRWEQNYAKMMLYSGIIEGFSQWPHSIFNR